jgi:hypothetical protein
MEKNRETFKPDIDSTLIRVIIYLFVLNAPFIGVYLALIKGELKSGQIPFLMAGIVFLLISAYFCNRFFNIRFGYDEDGVFKQGVFKHTHIRWDEIQKIYETGAAQEWTESDMLFIRKRGKGKKLFMVKSKTKKIAYEFYVPMIGFRKVISSKLNLKVGDDYNALWDFIVNS